MPGNQRGGRFRLTAATNDSISRSARHLYRALRDQGAKVDKQALTDGLTRLVNNIGQGKKPDNAAPATAKLEYNRAGDILAMAHQNFLAGDIEEAFYCASLAFTSDDCAPLIAAIVECNDQAVPADTAADDNDNNNDDNNNNNNDDAAGTLDTTDADTVTASEKRYRRKLQRAVQNVARRISATAGDDDNNNNNDDAESAVGGDDDDDDDNDNDNNNDDNNNNNNDDAAAGGGGNDENEVATAAAQRSQRRLINRLRREQPEIIASANKISMSGSKRSRRRAQEFVRRVGNIAGK